MEALSQNAVRVLKLLRFNPHLFYGEIAKQLDLPIDQVVKAADEIQRIGRATVRVHPQMKGGAA